MDPQPLASLPPSPVEEDIGRASAAWHEESTSTSGSTLAEGSRSPPAGGRRSKDKGKSRERDTGYRDDAGESSDEEVAEGYPPTKEEEAEARRVEENLRRWEVAERQRRKAARESQQSTATSSSALVDVTRKTSLLWSGRRNKRPSIDGAGSHHVLQQSNDDGVPLDDFDNRLVPSPGPDQTKNPFMTPNVSTTSLNTPYDSAVMTASSAGPEDDSANLVPSGSRSHPPPRPLDLPQPRSPPPLTQTPHTSRPPEPLSPPVVSPMPEVDETPRKKPLWFTDWLCGCGEKDDHQAARTNPFE